MKNEKFLIAIFALVFMLYGCSEEDLVENPPHLITADNLYTDAAGFEAGLNGLYALWRRETAGTGSFGSDNNLFIDITFAGTDIAYGNYASGWNQVGNEYDVRNTPTEGHNREFFEWLYEVINAANTIIVRAENPNIEWTASEKNRVIAEARFFRAWAYRHATYLYGDVPLTLEEATGSSVRSDWTRTPVAQVRAQMLEDLLFAEANLPETAEYDGKLAKGVATHYLAELYLTLDDYPNAIAKANSLINSGVYSLITERYGVKANQPGTPFTDMFLDGNSNKSEGNTEALWVMQFQLETNGGGNSILRRWLRGRSQSVEVNGNTGHIIFSVENGGRGLFRVAPTQFAMELYEPSDDRGGVYAWRTYEVINNPDNVPSGFALGDTTQFDWQGKIEPDGGWEWPSTRKWDYANPADLTDEESFNDQLYLRLAETYLILAEAQLENGDASGAATTLNVLRARSNASPITASDVTIDFILDERSRELWSEEYRRYALVRTGKLVERTQLYSRRYGMSISEKDKLLPIPQTVIDANTVPIEQNPGYN